jgi:hypothetical protein
MQRLSLAWRVVSGVGRLPVWEFALWMFPYMTVCLLIPYLWGGALMLGGVGLLIQVPAAIHWMATLPIAEGEYGPGFLRRLLGLVVLVVRTAWLAALLVPAWPLLLADPRGAFWTGVWLVLTPFLAVLAVRLLDLVVGVVLLPIPGTWRGPRPRLGVLQRLLDRVQGPA